MPMLSQRGQQAVNDLAGRYGLSTEAVTHLLYAVAAGNGTMAQFNHPELGGGGQWMQGGMIMLGDMFNNHLKATVDGLCYDLARLLNEQPFAAAPAPADQPQSGFYGGDGWPGNLGFGPASASGSQNNLRYAYFAGAHRLAIDDNGQVSVYDTLDHQIGGVSQQQGGGSSLSFSSQYGTVYLNNLPLLSGPGVGGQYSTPSYSQPVPAVPQTPDTAASPAQADILATLQKLADLHQQGILTDQEFSSKKAELLARL